MVQRKLGKKREECYKNMLLAFFFACFFVGVAGVSKFLMEGAGASLTFEPGLADEITVNATFFKNLLQRLDVLEASGPVISSLGPGIFLSSLFRQNVFELVARTASLVDSVGWYTGDRWSSDTGVWIDISGLANHLTAVTGTPRSRTGV